MPLPEPRKNESQDDFITRCMGDATVKKDFPDNKQALAVCFKQYRDKHPGAAPPKGAAQAGGDGPLYLTGASEGFELEAQAAAPDDGSDGKPRLRRFRMTGYTGVPMRIDGFYHPVIVDLAGMRVPNQTLPVLRSHDQDQIAGHTDSVEVTAQRIKLAGIVSGVGAAAQEVLALASNGFPWQASLGASVEKREFIAAGETASVNGRNWPGPLIVARATTLQEISFVPIGADHGTSASVAARHTSEVSTMFETWLAAKGIDPAGLSDALRKTLEAAYKAETAPPPPVAPPAPTPPPRSAGTDGARTVEDVANAARAELARRQTITDMVAAVMQENPTGPVIELCKALGEQAIEGKWPTDRLELELLRARRPQGFHLHVPTTPTLTDNVVEAAVCRNAGLGRLERYFDTPTLEAMDRHYPRGMGLQSLIGHFARRGGYAGHSVKDNLESAWRAAKRAPEIRAAGSWGPSTQGASIGSLLANVANKFFRDAFMAVEQAWREISAIRSANDFKQITTYSLTGDLTFRKLPPGGEIEHGQVDATSYTNQVDTYARMLGLDRRDVINDDLGAFSSVARRLGRGGGLALNTLFWGIFLNNSSFFTSGRNNLITGAGTTLQLSQLDVLNQKFLLQTDPDSKILGIMPKILLVPPALKVTAQTLMASAQVVSGATTAPGIPSANPWANAFRVVSSAYMQDSTLTGNSATAWYLLADPNDLPVIETAFLNGQDTPTVEEADSDFGMLGQSFRGYFDIGVSLQEYRAGAKSAGA